MLEFTTSSKLITELDNRITHQAVIGIDGVNGSGKTTLAEKIGSALKIPIYSTDYFSNKQREPYFKHFRYGELANKIQRVSGTIVMEGVFLLHIAKQINLKVTDLVYVKRKNRSGFYYDEDIFNPEEPVDEYIQRLNQELNEIPNILFNTNNSSCFENTGRKGLNPFTEQMIRYHAEFKPATIANYLYYWVDT